ncbi:hypothetical protein VTL71DRAFT_11263 [Oculimacula yallundae]|uniref:Uncharacterized protein n=1 Tax=Oculimacula yallundae TaxID=86028 RepID=A0ABR4CWG6_9HELO
MNILGNYSSELHVAQTTIEMVTGKWVMSMCWTMIECAVIELQGAALISKTDDEDITVATLGVNLGRDSGEDSGEDLEEELQPESGIKSTKVSLHRLVQEAVIYSRSPSDRQAIFDAAISVMYEAFPRQDGGMTIEAPSRAWTWHTGFALAVGDLDPVAEVMHLRYLYETGNDTTALTLLDFAYQVIDSVGMDKTSEFYADLAYKAGSVYMDWGFLTRCRKIWREAQKILEEKRAEGSESARLQLTWLWMAMANLEGAAGNHETSLELFNKSDEERLIDEKDNLWRHGICNLNIGRLYFFMGQYDKATERYKECEKGFLINSPTRAILDFALGDVSYAQNDVELARTWYSKAMQAFESSGTNPATLSSCYLRLARLELRENNTRLALEHIRKATHIVKRHAHSKGDQARIFHVQSLIQTALGRTEHAMTSSGLAEEHRAKLAAILEKGGEPIAEFDGSENAWDSLVCFFWR